MQVEEKLRRPEPSGRRAVLLRRRGRPSRRRLRSGQALIELVAVLPLLLIIIIGILELGTMIYQHMKMTAALAEVSKVAFSNGRTVAQLEAIFDATYQLDPSTRTLTITTQAVDPDVGGFPSVTIHAAVDHQWIGFWTPNGEEIIQLHSEVRTPVVTVGGAAGLLVPVP